jgi:SAM-dependent methyltransferase
VGGGLQRFGQRVVVSVRWHVAGLFGIQQVRERFLRGLQKGAVCAEIGVFRGQFSEKILSVTKPRELHLIDVWWELYGEHYPDWGAYTDHGELPTRQAYEDTLSVVQRCAGKAVVKVHVGDDCEILETFPDGYFDWVYLDSSHQYEDTLRELEILSRKVKPDGVISGDDWKDDPVDPNHGASVAIQEFCAARHWHVDARDTFFQWRISRDVGS